MRRKEEGRGGRRRGDRRKKGEKGKGRKTGGEKHEARGGDFSKYFHSSQ
jgi:hypothetical protein